MKASKNLAMLATLLWPGVVEAQENTFLTAVDSANLRVAVLQTLLDSLDIPWTDSIRLWVNPPRRCVQETAECMDLQVPQLSGPQSTKCSQRRR